MFYVDIPKEDNIDQFSEGEFLNVAQFETREEAIAFAKEHFGADDNGMISLVTGG